MNEIRDNYKHLLLTRFNIDSGDAADYRLNDAYLKVRFELFERYCLPSVQNQTNQNFIWLLLLDENTPNDYKDRIKLYQKKCNRITPVYLPTHLDNANEVYARIGQEYALDVDFLVTTRLDNDDALHKDYVKDVQKIVLESNSWRTTVISFMRGLQLYEKRDIAFRLEYVSNHFVSLIEPTSGSVRSALGYDHTKITKNFPCIIKKQLRWLEVVHDTNVVNNFSPSLHPRIYWPKSADILGFPVDLLPFLDVVRALGCWFQMYATFRIRQIKKFFRLSAGRIS